MLGCKQHTLFIFPVITSYSIHYTKLYDGKPVITNGPVLNVPYLKLGTWKLSAFFYTQGVSLAVVQIEGSYEGTMDVRFTLKIDSSGLIETAYRIERLYVTMPREIKLRVGVDCGGIDELGVAYTMNGNTNS